MAESADRFEYMDERTLRRADGFTLDILDSVSQLPWVRQLCPFMPRGGVRAVPGVRESAPRLAQALGRLT